MNKPVTFKEKTKDVLAVAAALGIPLLAASFDAWGFLADILVIVPFVWLGLRRSEIYAVLTALLAVAGVYFITQSAFTAVSKGLLLLGVSFALITGFKRAWKPGKTLFWGSLVWLPYVLFSLYVIGPDPIGQLQKAYADMFQQANMLQVMQNTWGIDASQAKDALLQYSQIGATVFPSVLFLNGIAVVGGNFLLSRYVVQKGLGIKTRIGPFREWTLPWYAIWGAILGLAAYLAGANWNIVWLTDTGLNIGFVYFVVCLVLGTAITSYLFTSARVPRFVKILLLVMVFLSVYGLIMIAALGLFDLVLNFRKIPEST